jgi:hypothetical protein
LSRAIIISFFIFAVSFGMVITNTVNTLWQADYGAPLIGYSKTPYLNYSQVNIAQDRTTYNSTMADISDVRPPPGVDTTVDIYQNVKYSQILFDLLFTATFGFPLFLTGFGMPTFLVPPLSIFLVINHTLALIYIVTGRTFIY